MKATKVMVLVALLATATSCKKNYTCSCQLKAGGVSNMEIAEKMNKKEAKSLCESANVGPTSPYSSCTLK
jgi:hypothetical protein